MFLSFNFWLFLQWLNQTSCSPAIIWEITLEKEKEKKNSPISCQGSFGQILALLIGANLKQQSAPVSGARASFGSSSGNCALSFGLSFFTKPGLCPGMWRPDLDRCCSEPFADERPLANSPSQLKSRERQFVQIVH